MAIKIAPSILSADFGHLQRDVDLVKNADMLHLDIMDGHFVPNITIGPAVVRCIKSNLPREAHLMLSEPEKYIEPFVKAGSSMVTVHACSFEGRNVSLRDTLKLIKELGAKPAVALNPNRPLSLIRPVLGMVDMVLLMTVFPGFGGQEFIASVLPKIKQLRSEFSGDIAVDGGINDVTVKDVVRSGANVIIAGSFIFKEKNPGSVVELLRKKAQEI
mgnify:CR=1 FL=1